MHLTSCCRHQVPSTALRHVSSLIDSIDMRFTRPLAHQWVIHAPLCSILSMHVILLQSLMFSASAPKRCIPMVGAGSCCGSAVYLLVDNRGIVHACDRAIKQ